MWVYSTARRAGNVSIPTATSREEDARKGKQLPTNEIEWIPGPGGRSDPRSVGKVRVGDIVVDQRVQRTIDALKVDWLSENWDWALGEVVTVREREDGELVAIEGQHRALALKAKDPAIEIWVVRAEGAVGIEDEAAIALGIAKGRRPHSRVHEWRMRVTAGLEHEVEAEKVLNSLGLTVTSGHSGNTISAAGTLMRVIHGTQARPRTAQSGAMLLRRTLTAIQTAIPDDPSQPGRRYDSSILMAVAQLIATYPSLNLGRLEEKLSARTAPQWLAFRHTTSPAWKGVQGVIQDDYNRSMRAGRLL
jgi:hypothetical protein